MLYAEEKERQDLKDRFVPDRKFWFRMAAGIFVGVVGMLIILRNVNLGDIVSAFQDAAIGYILIALLIILVTLLTKAWRWQLIFKSSPDHPGFSPLFWALVTGQFFNILIPLRTGEIARLLSLEQLSRVSKSMTLSTLVVEKTLDIAGLVMTILLILPFMTIPEEVSSRANTLAVIMLILLPMLFLIAYNSGRLKRFAGRFEERLPIWLRSRFVQILGAGLDGLAAFRNKRLTVGLSIVTILVVLLSILTPLILFSAFSLPLGIREAIIINLVVTVATAPPSTPGRIVIFLAIVRIAMEGFGIENASLILSYSIAFLFVVYAPSLILGGLALAKGGYRLPFRKEGTEA